MKYKRFVATVLTSLFGFGTLVPTAMAANEKAAHNIAIGSTAAAAYLLLHRKTRGVGLLAAGGAAYAWKKHHDAVKERHQRERRYSYYRSRSYSSRPYYGSNYSRYYGRRTRTYRAYRPVRHRSYTYSRTHHTYYRSRK